MRTTEEDHVVFSLANEYQDFVEFLQNELGFDEVKELQDKFYKQEDQLNIEAYEKLFPKDHLTKE